MIRSKVKLKKVKFRVKTFSLLSCPNPPWSPSVSLHSDKNCAPSDRPPPPPPPPPPNESFCEGGVGLLLCVGCWCDVGSFEKSPKSSETQIYNKHYGFYSLQKHMGNK